MLFAFEFHGNSGQAKTLWMEAERFMWFEFLGDDFSSNIYSDDWSKMFLGSLEQ